MGRRRSQSSLTGVSGILKRSFKTLKLNSALREYKIFKVWNEAVGDRIAAKTKPFRVIGSTLYVKVSSSPWMQELNFMKADILDKLNTRITGKKVEDIILRPGRWEKKVTSNNSESPPWLDVHLSKKDEDSIKKRFASVKDLELRETLFRLRISEKRLRAFKKKASRQK
ncbi:MAG: DUF721 domain-containing protein [Thermodesulfobacteriota bacterium]